MGELIIYYIFVGLSAVVIILFVIAMVLEYRYVGGTRGKFLSVLAKQPTLSPKKVEKLKRNIIRLDHPAMKLLIPKRGYDQNVVACVSVYFDDPEYDLVKMLEKTMDSDRGVVRTEEYLELVRLLAVSKQARLAKQEPIGEHSRHEAECLLDSLNERIAREKEKRESLNKELEQKEALTMLHRIADNNPHQEPVELDIIREPPEGEFEVYSSSYPPASSNDEK